MKYHNIPFYIASQSVQSSKKIAALLGHQNNTIFTTLDIPEVYSYLKKCNSFTCFVLQITDQPDILTTIIKSINQKNPDLPIILISHSDLSVDLYRKFVVLGATDVLCIDEATDKKEILTNVINALNLKWRSYLFTKKENEKIFKASVVSINHEINQPLTVILNAVGLLKAELKQIMEKDIKVNSHLNFIAKSITRIQSILDNLKSVRKIALKEYTPGVWMINLDSEPTQQLQSKKTKINNKNTVLVVEKNLSEDVMIHNEISKMGLEIIKTPNLKHAEKLIDKYIQKIQAVIFSANIPAEELESTMLELNSRSEIVPLVIVRSAEIPAENLKILDSTAFQIVNKPISSKALQDAIANSVIVAN